MINLMIYISRTGSFNNPCPGVINDTVPLVKVQIENSLALGWKKEDIMLVTNFDYQYGFMKATVFKDIDFFDPKPQASKINAIIKLFENKKIKKGQLYWFHDFDAFQLHPITEAEIDLGEADMGLSDYGRYKRWSTGSIFFKSSSKDIFYRIREHVYKENIDEERVLTSLTDNNEDIRKRIKKINRTYNFTTMNLKQSYKSAIKPLRVVHFHPLAANRPWHVQRSLDYFKGDNYINTPLLTERLIKIFKYHRIR